MKFKMNKLFRLGLTAFIVIAASICFYYLLFHGTNIQAGISTLIRLLMPIIFGFVMAYLMTPILNHIEYRILIPFCNKCKIKESNRRARIIRGISIVLTVFLFFAIICGLISTMVSQIVPSIANIVSNFDQYINNFVKWLNKLLSDYPDIGSSVVKMVNKYSAELEKWLNESVLPKSSELIKTVSLSVIGMLKIIWNFLIGFIISIYVLASKEKFAGQAKKIVYALFNKDIANIIINNFKFTHRTFTGFLSGKILDSILIGLLCFIGTSLLQTPYAVLVSVVVGVTNIIPVFGPYLGAVPSAILIFVVDPSHPLNCVYFAIFILALQQFDGNFLGPKILGNSTGLTGFWVIFAITFFGGLFGIFGMLIGVPLFAVIYAAIKSFINSALKKKMIPQDTDAYIKVAAITEDGIYEYIPEYQLKRSEKDKSTFGREFLCSLDGKKLYSEPFNEADNAGSNITDSNNVDSDNEVENNPSISEKNSVDSINSKNKNT